MSLVAAASGQVSYDRILNANKEPQNWLTYSGSYSSQRYSLLNQVTPANVKNLRLRWVWHPKYLEKMEATPLVVDGILYTVQNSEVGRWTRPLGEFSGPSTMRFRQNRIST